MKEENITNADARMARKAATAARNTLCEAGGYGAAIALAADGKLLLSKGVGWLDWQRTLPFRSDGSAYVWSITKTLYAVVVLQAVESALLGLDDPANQYLPELEIEPAVTVRRLLNHTAGIPDYSDRPEYRSAVQRLPDQPWTAAEFLARTIQSDRLLFVPGAGWAYSNIGYLIIRRILERVIGQPMASILRSSIFRPLCLNRFRLADARDDSADLFPGWSTIFDAGGSPCDASRIYHPAWVSHGTAAGPAGELAMIFEGIFDGKLLGPSSLEAMLDAKIVSGDHWLFKNKGYGLGLMIDRNSRFGVIAGHGGEGPGYSTAVLHFSNAGGRRVTAVALANSDVPDLGLRIAYAMAASVAGWN